MSEWREVNSSAEETWDRVKPIEGILKEVKHNIGRNKSEMYLLEVNSGLVGVWGSTVLDTKMSSVPLGAEVHIECLGKATGKSGNEYIDFRVMWRPAPFKEVDYQAPQSPTANAEELDDDKPPIESYDDLD